MAALIWLIVGVVAGLLAHLVLPREAPGGIMGDLIAGLIGAAVCGYMAQTYFIGHVSSNELLWNFVLASIGAFSVIGLAHMFAGPEPS